MAGERGLNKKLPQGRSIVRLCGEVRFKVVFALTAVYCAGAVLLMRKTITRLCCLSQKLSLMMHHLRRWVGLLSILANSHGISS